MNKIITSLFLFVSIMLITLIVLQKGKGAHIGSSIDISGVSRTLFGPSGSANFMTNTICILSIFFFILCLLLGNRTHEIQERKQKNDLLKIKENEKILLQKKI